MTLVCCHRSCPALQSSATCKLVSGYEWRSAIAQSAVRARCEGYADDGAAHCCRYEAINSVKGTTGIRGYRGPRPEKAAEAAS